MIKSPVTISLNMSTYVPVTLNEYDSAYGFSVYAVDASGDMAPFYFATDESGSDGAPCPTLGLEWGDHHPAGETVMYAKAFNDDTTLVLRPGRKPSY